MTLDGFVEASSNRRLGRRVIHSDLTEKKLMEVRKALDMDAMDVDLIDPVNKSNRTEMETIENSHRDLSTCGVLRSFGSDFSGTRGKSDPCQNGSIRSDKTISKRREGEQTPTSMAEPVPSRESFAQGVENDRENNNTNFCEDFDTTTCSRSTQEKRLRKASKVKDPILQYSKRQKAQDL